MCSFPLSVSTSSGDLHLALCQLSGWGHGYCARELALPSHAAQVGLSAPELVLGVQLMER